MSKKNGLPNSTQELIKAIGTKAQLKKKLQALPTEQLEKVNNLLTSVTQEILSDRQAEAEQSKRIQNLVEETLSNLSKEHDIPLEEIIARTSKL